MSLIFCITSWSSQRNLDALVLQYLQRLLFKIIVVIFSRLGFQLKGTLSASMFPPTWLRDNPLTGYNSVGRILYSICNLPTSRRGKNEIKESLRNMFIRDFIFGLKGIPCPLKKPTHNCSILNEKEDITKASILSF